MSIVQRVSIVTKEIIVGAIAAGVLAVAVPVFATDVTIGGEIRVRGRSRVDRDFDKSDLPGALDRARLDERIRLWLTGKVVEDLKVYLELESLGRMAFGAASPQSNTEDSFGREGAGVPVFRFAYVDARLPGNSVTFRLGRQPMQFGNGYVFDTGKQVEVVSNGHPKGGYGFGGDAITANGRLWDWTWEIGWVKTRETDITGAARDYPSGYTQPATSGVGTPGVDNDEEYFTFRAKGSPASHQLELYSVTHRDAGAFVVPAGPSAAAPFGSQSGGGALEDTIGLAWETTYGPFKPHAEAAYQFGTAYKLAVPRPDGSNKVTRSAWMFNVGGDYRVAPEWQISLDTALGSGNGKNPTELNFKHNHQWFQPNAYTSGPWYFSDDLGNPGSFRMGSGITNRSFEFNSVDNLGFIYLTVIRKYEQIQHNGIHYGDVWLHIEGTKLFAAKTFDGMGGIATTKPSRDLGWNVAGKVTWWPYRNLRTEWSAGAWLPGRYFAGGIPRPSGTQPGGTPGPHGDTAVILRWFGIVYF